MQSPPAHSSASSARTVRANPPGSRILAGDLRPSSGLVLRNGAMGYCPQQVVLNDTLTVNQHLDYFRSAYNITSLRRAEELVEQPGYQAYRRELVGTLSGGTKQKLNLTLALMHQPETLLLDEPYQGFDRETYLRFSEHGLCAP